MANKIKAFIAIALLCAGAAFADDTFKVKEPKKGHVLVVGRVTYKKPIDTAAREKPFRDDGYKNWEKSKSYDFSIKPDFAEKVYDQEFPYNEGYFYSELKPTKAGTVSLDHFEMGLFKKSYPGNIFGLPAGVIVSVPDEAVYVYIGTFEYDLDYALRVVGFRHLDDYEAAKKNLSRELQKDVELYRAPLDFDSYGKKKEKK